MNNTNTSFYLGLFLCALVLADVGLWIFAATNGSPTLSLLLLIRPGELVNQLMHVVRVPAIGANTILIAWNVFTLM